MSIKNTYFKFITLREAFIEDEGNELSFVINDKHIIFLKKIKVIKSKYYYQIKAKTIQHLLNISLLQLILNFFGILLKE